MQLGGTTIPITQMFDGQKRYKIPRYQRRYVWDDGNWEALWQDIVQLPERHFAGTIITSYNENTDDLEVVDGQQRLTTFQIIFCVIRDLWDLKTYSDLEDSESYEDIKDLKANIRGHIRILSEDIYRLASTKYDAKEFEKVVSSNCWKTLAINSSDSPDGCLADKCREGFQKLLDSEEHPIIRAYGYFGVQITDYCLRQGKSPDDKFQSLSDILKNFRVINAKLDPGEDPEKVFQIINDTGRMLDDFDYLRNYLFLRTRKYFGKAPSDKLYDDHWDKFEKWNPKELDLFFRAFLKAKLGPTCLEGEEKDLNPFDCYRKDRSILEDEDFIQLLQLSRYADSYKRMNKSTLVSKHSELVQIGNQMQFYSDLGFPRLDWFVLFMKHASEISDAELLKEHKEKPSDEKEADMILENYPKFREKCGTGLTDQELLNLCGILESYIVRRMLCCEEVEDIYQTICNVADSIRSRSTISMNDFVSCLLSKWPEPEKVMEALKADVFFKRDELILYILYRIELWKRECSESSKHPFCSLEFKDLVEVKKVVDPASLQSAIASKAVTTLATADVPDYQQPPPGYVPISGVEQAQEEAAEQTRQVAESIGNIKPIVKKTDELILTKEIDEKNWDTEKIRKRTDNLLECFNKIWKPNIKDYLPESKIEEES